jgi:hypothetical protein
MEHKGGEIPQCLTRSVIYLTPRDPSPFCSGFFQRQFCAKVVVVETPEATRKIQVSTLRKNVRKASGRMKALAQISGIQKKT